MDSKEFRNAFKMKKLALINFRKNNSAIEDIEKAIVEAAGKGEFKVLIERSLDLVESTYLTFMGYDVFRGEGIATVEWYNAPKGLIN